MAGWKIRYFVEYCRHKTLRNSLLVDDVGDEEINKAQQRNLGLNEQLEKSQANYKRMLVREKALRNEYNRILSEKSELLEVTEAMTRKQNMTEEESKSKQELAIHLEDTISGKCCIVVVV